MVGVLDALSEDLDDRRSQHSVSTVATTTSLASRIAALNCDFGDKLLEADESQPPVKEEDEEGLDDDNDDNSSGGGCNARADDGTPSAATQAGGGSGGGGGNGGCGGGSGSGGGTGDAQLSLEEIVRLVTGREPPLQVCSRLFVGRSHPPIPLKRLSMMQVEDFRQHGYVVVDGLLPTEAAARLRAEALRLAARGRFSTIGGAVLRASFEGSRAGVDGSGASGSVRSPAAAIGTTSIGQRQQQHFRQQPPPAPPQRKPQQPPPPQQHQRPSEQRLVLQLGSPPADTAPFASLLAALQEVQDDLHEFMRLKQRGRAEYALSLLPAGASSLPRHRDALPDDGCGYLTSLGQLQPQQPQQPQQQAAAVAMACASMCSVVGGAVGGPSSPRPPAAAAVATAAAAAAATVAVISADPSLLRRVSILVFLNPNWEREGGGCLRLWPPQRQSMLQQGAGVSGRRSPTSSDAGTTFSEGASECSSSLRLHHFLGSTTSSVVAEAASAVADHADVASLDGRLSLADSDVEAGARCCGFEWVDAEDGMALDVAPLAGRAVLMLAGAVDHALLAPAVGAGDMAYVRAWCS